MKRHVPDCRREQWPTYALLLESGRRPVLDGLVRRWTDACHGAVGRLLRAARSTNSASDAELLFAAADRWLIVQPATGDGGDLSVRLRRLATHLVTPT